MNADEIVRIDEAVKALHRLSELLVTPDSRVCREAADLIESLQAQLAAKEAEIERLREAQRWRNAETEPPKCEDGAETGPILYRMKTTGTIEVGYYGRKGRWRDSYFRHMRNASDGVDADDVSDWMPLPAAPEEGAEK